MSLPAKRLAAEAVPVAVVLTFWTVASWLFVLRPEIQASARDAGIVMAVLYVVVRGVSLAPAVTVPATVDLGAVLRENARVAVGAGVWFVGAGVVHLVEQFWYQLGGPGLYLSPTGWLIRVLAGAGLGVVGLYAVAAGTAAVRREGAPAGVPGDD